MLGQKDFSLRVPSKRGGRLPEPFSRIEIAKILETTRNLKHRALLMTAYGRGLRVSEVVHLQPHDIHSERMLIRVNQGKGRKDRCTLLSHRLLASASRAILSLPLSQALRKGEPRFGRGGDGSRDHNQPSGGR